MERCLADHPSVPCTCPHVDSQCANFIPVPTSPDTFIRCHTERNELEPWVDCRVHATLQEADDLVAACGLTP